MFNCMQFMLCNKGVYTNADTLRVGFLIYNAIFRAFFQTYGFVIASVSNIFIDITEF